MNNILYILQNNCDSDVLLECCISLKIIIGKLDSNIKSNNPLNLSVNKQKLEEDIKSKINWPEVLNLVSAISFKLFSEIKSSETLLGLVNLFNGLIGKCHYQCNGEIIKSLKESRLTEIVLNIKDEFGQNAFIEMWKSLLVSFPDSYELFEIIMTFISVNIKVNIYLKIREI